MNSKAIDDLAVLVVMGIIIFIIRLRTGKSFRTILKEYKQLSDYALIILVVVVIIVFLIFVVINN